MKAAQTKHASADRAGWEEFATQLHCISEERTLQKEVNGLKDPTLVLNTYRQTVFANHAFLRAFEVVDPATVYGCRPGEILGCIYASEGIGGCGTSKHCRKCNAVAAILESVRGAPDMRACFIQTSKAAEPIETVIFTMPLKLQGHSFILVELVDAQTNTPAEHALILQRIVKRVENS